MSATLSIQDNVPAVPAPKPDAAEMARALSVLHEPGAIVELRALFSKGRKRTDAGYFDGEHRATLVKEASRLNAAGAAVYITMNDIDPQLLSRYANRVQEFAPSTATDLNVVRRRWFLIDLDPVRPKDTSATDAQVELATDRARQVYRFLGERGWPAPVVADSGNGMHLLYRVDMDAGADSSASAALIKRCLESLSTRFDDDAVKVDRSVFNAGRIIKLHGSVANKGDHVPSAPWRVSEILTVPDQVELVSEHLLHALAGDAVEASTAPRTVGAFAGTLNQFSAWGAPEMESFLSRGNIDATGPEQHDGALRWKLKSCPFNPDHGPGESAVFLRPDGRLGFECRHNSCQDKHWRDLRALVDGDRRGSLQPGASSSARDSAQAHSDEPELRATQPEPLRRPLPPPEEYPMDALGDVLGAAARRLADTVQAPAALCGQSILAAASLAAQAHADVLIDGRLDPLSLFHVTIAESGERKSGVDTWALRVHREYERREFEQYTHAKEMYEVELQAFESANRSITKGKDQLAIKSALCDLGSPPVPPLMPLLLVGTPTMEGIHKLYAVGRPTLGLFHDDAAEFLGGHAMNSDNRTKSAAGLSKLWDRGEFDRVRSGDGAEKFFGRRLAMHLMMQPIIAESVLSDDVLTGQGFLARSLLAWPSSTIGTRCYREIDLRTDPEMIRYWARMETLLARGYSLRPETRNELEPRALTLTPAAKRRYIAIHDLIEADMLPGGDFASVRAWASKSPAQALRIAGVLTLVDDADAMTISEDALERGAMLMQFYLSEAVRIVGTSSVPVQVRRAEALLEWCHSSGRRLLHSSAALQFGPAAIRTRAAFDEAIAELEKAGWAQRIDGGCTVDGSHRRRVWAIWEPRQ